MTKNCKKCGKPKEKTRPNSHFCRRCDSPKKRKRNRSYAQIRMLLIQAQAAIEVALNKLVEANTP